MFMSGGEPVTGPLEPARHYIWGPEVGQLKKPTQPNISIGRHLPLTGQPTSIPTSKSHDRSPTRKPFQTSRLDQSVPSTGTQPTQFILQGVEPRGSRPKTSPRRTLSTSSKLDGRLGSS
ncbi:hypothetical protein PGT21_020405 [Puccinia graminis f. sp. tritici]|uniref:Uncharacterized protein n=1 Tax=Puccinia graminis f. sp. tritici TaxID=56615 RepID=A0A5B0NZS0_PUCGR|nr:hypothetical protein PGTUg99_005726 [Puccinia graminis f. sp. tritici]KAA1094413.1 hypothetical protein PGT21_020405 [Puccinia graminis f. sp. tritici]